MCGIAALIALKNGSVPPECLGAMLDLVRYRGPDDEGWAAFDAQGTRAIAGGGPSTPAACFGSGLPYAPVSRVHPTVTADIIIGHRRLAIVDVSPMGHQPMSYGDGRYWIVFNGEIYNHFTLRSELELRGHRFFSRSDTEVVLAAYAEWGAGGISRLDGMFSLILFDRKTQSLFVVRDRFGIKPLYYWISPAGLLAMASEIKQFTVLPGWKPRLNGQRAYDFLAWSILDHTDETMFDGVFQLRPGYSIQLDLHGSIAVSPGGRLPTRQWYRLTAETFGGSLQEAGSRFRELFSGAVQAHLRADVPVGSCLSGGLDSSSIVCIMSDLLHRQGVMTSQHTFSACSIIRQFDEREYVDHVVRHIGAEAHYIYPDLNGLFSQLDQITWHQDEPFGSSSIFAQWLVFGLASRIGVKVLLDGQGADEQLAGYPQYLGANFSNLFRRLDWIRLVREMNATSKIHSQDHLWVFKIFADAVLPDPIRGHLRRIVGREKLHPQWLNLARLGASPSDPIGGSGRRSIQDLSYSQLTSSNLQMLLHWEDRNSMAHSVEARVPFLDHHLVELVLGLPDAYKLQRGVTKRVLREGLRGVLPEMIRTRTSKLGFATPEEHWLCDEAPERFRQAVKDAIAISQGIIRPEALCVVDGMISRKRHFDFSVWRMLSFAAWMNRFRIALV